jgi:hypothetical protein
VLLALLTAGCATAAGSPTSSLITTVAPPPTEQPSPSPEVGATSGPSPSPSPTVEPFPSESVFPTATPAPTGTPVAPTVDAFWDAAETAVHTAGRLRIRVIGPAPGELRYEVDASATVINGNVVFVCRDGRAYDGQSAWMEVPGSWTCGAAALVAGFRQTGQPLDAWSPELPPDEEIEQSVTLRADGTWQWEYRGRNPFAGGRVHTLVVLDPADGQIRSASRIDPTGETTYGISYSESFPRIAIP